MDLWEKIILFIPEDYFFGVDTFSFQVKVFEFNLSTVIFEASGANFVGYVMLLVLFFLTRHHENEATAIVRHLSHKKAYKWTEVNEKSDNYNAKYCKLLLFAHLEKRISSCMDYGVGRG
jgi:hypothetical protein